MSRSAVVLFAVAGGAFIAATTLTAVVISADIPEPSDNAPPTITPLAATATTQTTRPVGPPACLIGTWRSTDEHTTVKFYTDQPPFSFTGRGRFLILRPDGTGGERREGFTQTAQYRGREQRIVSDGKYEFRWSADAKAITYEGPSAAEMTFRYFDHRGLLNTQPLVPDPNWKEVDNYTCSATRLTETATNSSGYRSVWVRTKETGVYG
ncbi:hypothetical protein LWC34_15880 [Kibdelosporangium philippinense]|uniref:Uncharacterized protein n=1 Tax=Kibdelosporangium philippinense TaxID=211113 RepID=A0ABS8Z8V1_9PSEU|nr:hypothetical protein [Kibdelosporangium philippinense]MCE7004304.1 hypothetical protein [Kibdelosporangium philippinense]